MAGLAVVVMLVILRIAAASWSNVLQKQALQQHTSASCLLVNTWAWMTLISAPVWLWAISSSFYEFAAPASALAALWREAEIAPKSSFTYFTISDPTAFWCWMLLAMLLEMPGNWLLLRSLQHTDLSIYGPLNSFKPIVGLIAAIWLLNELPSPQGLIGVCVVLLGTYWLAEPTESRATANWKALLLQRGVRDRMLALILTATASVFLKRAMNSASQWTVLAIWSLVGWLLAIMFFRGRQLFDLHNAVTPDDSGGLAKAVSQQFFSQRVFLIAISMLVMQGLTIDLFRLIPVAYALALFQLGGLVSAYLGYRVFGEPHLWRRLMASAIMVIGAILIVFAD